VDFKTDEPCGSSPTSRAVAPAVRCDVGFCSLARRGRRRVGEVSTPRRKESATMALNEEDRGDASGPGIILDMDLLDSVDGLSVLGGEGRRVV
jgi:hypothetical protein